MVKKTEEEMEIEELEAETRLVEANLAEAPALTPEQIASRELAHSIKVAKCKAGGEF